MNKKVVQQTTEQGASKNPGQHFLRKSLIIAGLLVLLCLFSYYPALLLEPGHAAESTAAVSTATREGRLAVFDDVWQTINDRYYDGGFAGLDWNAQRAAFRPLAAKAADPRQFYRVLRRMIGLLNDPHTRVYGPDEKFDWWHPRFVTVGLMLREIEGKPTVVQVESGSPAEHAGIRPGDVIESVDGETAESIIEQQEAQSSGATSTSRLSRMIAMLLDGPPGSSVNLRWQGKNGEEKSSQLIRYWQQRQLTLHARRVQKYAVVQLDAFTESTALDFARVLKEKLRNVKGIVIDLRENGGGDAEAMAEIASSFLDDGVSLGKFIDRWGSSFKVETRSKSLFTPQTIVKTDVPLVVLTSDRTSSAAEILVAALRTAGRAEILGSETCGCVLAIRTRHTLPDGGVLDVSELDYRTSQGARLEGRSIKPDETVRPERKDLYAHRDRMLDSALEELRKVPSANAFSPKN